MKTKKRKRADHPEQAWSPRSQKAGLEERRLKENLKSCDGRISGYQQEIAATEKQVGHLTEDGGRPRESLREKLAELENLKRELANSKKYKASLQSDLKRFARSTISQTAGRRKHQIEVARLALERLAKDRLIDRAFASLRGLLAQRGEITTKMRAQLDAIDFEHSFESIDQSRFDSLLESLPVDRLAIESQQWVNRLFGKTERGARPYRVRRPVVLPENLKNAGLYYSAGETVDLTEEAAATVVEDNRLSNYLPAVYRAES